jgi:hypothetical protein
MSRADACDPVSTTAARRASGPASARKFARIGVENSSGALRTRTSCIVTTTGTRRSPISGGTA